MYAPDIKLPCNLSIVQLIQEKSYFMYCRDKVLFYKTESGFVIRVPVEETGTGQFNHEHEKSLIFLRWLRPQYNEAIKVLNEKIQPPNPEVKLLTEGEPVTSLVISTPDGFREHHAQFD